MNIEFKKQLEKEKELREYIKHLEDSKEEILNSLYINKKGYDDKFNLTLTTNGKTITMEMDADVWINLKKLIEEKLN